MKFIYDKEPLIIGYDIFRNTPLLDKIKVPKNYEGELFCNQEISKELYVGRCGDNVRWIIENEELNIYGSGEMYNDYNESVFKEYKNNISSIIIEEGITSIEKNIFNGINGFVEMFIPSSISKIGDNSFS